MRLNFKQLIDTSGLTQTQIAKKLNVSYPTINNLYNGTAKSIYFDKLEELCNLLHCTPNDVLIMDANSENKNDSETTTLESTYTIPNDLRELIIKQIRLELDSLMKDFITDKNNDDSSK